MMAAGLETIWALDVLRLAPATFSGSSGSTPWQEAAALVDLLRRRAVAEDTGCKASRSPSRGLNWPAWSLAQFGHRGDIDAFRHLDALSENRRISVHIGLSRIKTKCSPPA